MSDAKDGGCKGGCKFSTDLGPCLGIIRTNHHDSFSILEL